MGLLAQVDAIDMSSGLPEGFSAGYQKSEIELNNLEGFAKALEAAVINAGLKPVLNIAQIRGSRTRTDGTKVCRYSVSIKAVNGKTIGNVSVYDNGKVAWDGMSPDLVTPPENVPAPTKTRKTRKPAEVGEAAAVSV